MKVLFLVDEVECENEKTIRKISDSKEGAEVVVLGLSTLADLALRNKGVDYKTPNMYFSKEKAPALDKKAYALARDWYKFLDPSVISYRGVSLGEVLEYEFYHLLVDALRSVEISSSLLEESFDVVYVPSHLPCLDDSGISFQTVCYQTLPLILSDMARKKGIRVESLSPPVELSQPSQRRRSIAFSDQGFVVSNLLFIKKNLRSLLDLVLHRNLKRVAIAACPITQEELIESMRGTRGRGFKTYPAVLQSRKSSSSSRSFLDLLGDETTTSELDEVFVHDGHRFWRAILPFVRGVLSKLVPLITGRVNWAYFFARTFKPSSFVTFQDITPLSRSACEVLKNRGVYIVLMQHGTLTHDMAGMYLLPKVGHVQAVWGEYYKQWHVDRGMSPASQIVTGFPRHDRLRRLPPVDREAVCKRHGLDLDLKIVLVATEWFQSISTGYTVEEEEGFIRRALRALKPLLDHVQIVVKLHPHLQARYSRIVAEIARQEGMKVVVAGDELWNLILASQLVVVSVSSVMVEALLLDVPVATASLVDIGAITGMKIPRLAAEDREGSDAISPTGEGTNVPAVDDNLQVLREEISLDYFTSIDSGCSSGRIRELGFSAGPRRD